MGKRRWLGMVIAGTLWAGPAAAHEADVALAGDENEVGAALDRLRDGDEATAAG